jgi:hypothetical protein
LLQSSITQVALYGIVRLTYRDQKSPKQDA